MADDFRVLIAAHIRWHNAEAEYAHRLARGLWARGVKAVIWGRAGSPLLDRAAADNIPVVAAGDPASLDPARMYATARLARELVTRGGFSVVNAQRSEGFPLIAWAARRAGAAVVRTRGDMRLPRMALVNREVYRRLTDFVISGNDLIKEELHVRLGLPEDKVRTVHFGIRPGEVTPEADERTARAALGLGPEARVVGVMGRLGPVKGQEFVLKAADQVVEKVPDVRFLIIYRDVEDSDKFLPALRRSRHRGRFVLVGPGADHVSAMQLAEVAVVPSVGSEAHCRVALEWMDLKKPVIGSRVGVIPEIIVHGATGFLVQPRYSDTIAHCLIELLTSPQRARRMGLAGRQRLIERFSEESMVDENLEVFRRAASERGRQR
ncbi:MAG TPA: glycosyltransferase family 4 protein [bacterium]|nr:glycosyltransferase family 4 protein [bacterium]